MPSSSSSVWRGIFIVLCIALAPLLLGLVAIAAGDWRQIGSTPSGDEVFVSSLSSPRNGQRTAWVRVQYKEPVKLPQGGPFLELRARVRFNCLSGSAVSNSEWLYSRDRGGKLVVSKKTRRDDQFGLTSEGGFGEIARDFVCKQK